MKALSPLHAISLGLVLMTVSLIFMGDALVGLMPGHTRQLFDYRRTVSEALAVQYSLLASRQELSTIKSSMTELLTRNQDLRSVALIDQQGTPISIVGDHEHAWVQPKGDESTIDHIQVPIFDGATKWGTLQLAFTPIETSGLEWLRTNPWAHFLLFVSFVGYLGYNFFMKRTLRHLDPSAVIPPRVKATLDVLDEGVVMLNRAGRVVLANDSFCHRVNSELEPMLGQPLSDLPWTDVLSTELPWVTVLKSKASRTERRMGLAPSGGAPRSFVVTAAAISDERGKTRGCMVSFSDVTDLEQANYQLQGAITALETSKAQVVRQNQELEVTNDSLQTEIQERLRIQAEREELSKRLIETSRRVGMADVASTVLHNVGNVLNSVNVSVEVVSKTLRQAPINDVALIATLLREHAADLGHFLTEDPKGKQVPAYLSMLAEAVKNNSTLVDKELGALAKNIEHIRQVVTRQVDLARPGEMLQEPVKFSDLFDQALGINRPALEKAHIQILQEFSPMPEGLTDQHQVLQILVNLVTNAKNAMLESPPKAHRLTLRLELVPQKPGFARFQVIDTGVGIKPDNLSRLFTQGFTTRKEGHGIGLHSAAIAAKNLGGALTASSEGEGCGATFTLELPLQPVSTAVAA